MSTVALLERPAARHTAGTVSALALPSNTPRGVHFVVADATALPGQVEAGDLLRIDFDQREFGMDSLYVVQLPRGVCVRRIDHSLRGPVIDDGDARRPLGDTVRILGRVLQVYAPRRPGSGGMR